MGLFRAVLCEHTPNTSAMGLFRAVCAHPQHISDGVIPGLFRGYSVPCVHTPPSPAMKAAFFSSAVPALDAEESPRPPAADAEAAGGGTASDGATPRCSGDTKFS